MKKNSRGLLPLTSDLVFKAVYGSDNEESKRALIALLNLILDRKENPIVDITYKNPFSISQHEGEKQVIMDIKAETADHELIDIEMQMSVLPFYQNRALYYGAKLLTEGLQRGEEYVKMKKTIVISIVNEIAFPDFEEPHSVFVVYEPEKQVVMTNILELHFLELGKIRIDKNVEEMRPIDRVGVYLRYANDESKAEYIARLREKEEVIALTEEIHERISEDEALRELERARDLFIRDQNTILGEAKRAKEALEKMQEKFKNAQEEGRIAGHAEGRAEGHAEGRAEGHAEAEESIAKKMKNEGLSMEQIARITGLTAAEIEALQ